MGLGFPGIIRKAPESYVVVFLVHCFLFWTAVALMRKADANNQGLLIIFPKTPCWGDVGAMLKLMGTGLTNIIPKAPEPYTGEAHGTGPSGHHSESTRILHSGFSGEWLPSCTHEEG